MRVREVVRLATEWVTSEGARTPGYAGAHLVGGLAGMPADADFPLYRDVDVAIVSGDAGAAARTMLDISYRGLILERGFAALERYRSAEGVLSDPGLAPSLAVDSILSDPTGLLTRLKRVVVGEYGRQRWVGARCEAEKSLVVGSLPAIRAGDWVSLLSAATSVAGLVAVAGLVPPTHRRCFIVMKELVQRHGRPDLHERALEVSGFSHLSRPLVEASLEGATAVFDRGTQVHRTETEFGHMLCPHVRPYFVETTREMIEEGHHREAAWWILFFQFVGNTAIQLDGDPEEKPHYQAALDGSLGELGLGRDTDWPTKARQMGLLLDDVSALTDDLVRTYPA